MDNKNTNIDLLRVLNNKRSLKAFFKNMPLKKANSIQNKLFEVISELEEEEAFNKQQAKQKKEILIEAVSSLKEKGISEEEIVGFLS